MVLQAVRATCPFEAEHRSREMAMIRMQPAFSLPVIAESQYSAAEICGGVKHWSIGKWLFGDDLGAMSLSALARGY